MPMERNSMEKYGRNESKLIHDYFGINYSIVCDVVKNKIPELTKQIEKVLTENE